MLDAATRPCVDTPNGAADGLAWSATPCGGNARWACVYTHPQAERWAEQNLTRIGFVAYLPTMTIQRRDRAVRSLTHPVTVPLFSRYLFVQQDNPEHWRPIREAPGVHSVLTNGNRLQYAPEGAVEAVRAGEDVRRTTPTDHPTKWAPGTPCSLRTGIMAGHPAVVLAVSRNSARVGLLFLGQMTTFRVPVEYLTARYNA